MLFSLAVIPSIALLIFIYRLDKKEKEDVLAQAVDGIENIPSLEEMDAILKDDNEQEATIADFSEDVLYVYSDGHTYCYSCNNYRNDIR